MATIYTMEKAARKGGFFKFQCPGDLQAAVTPEPTCQILTKLLQKVKATNLPVVGQFGFPQGKSGGAYDFA
jgi:hypothetical protein